MYAINSSVEKDRHSVDYSLAFVCVRVFFEWGGGLMLIPKPSLPVGTCGSDKGCMTAELSTFPYCKGSQVHTIGCEAVVLATQGSLVYRSPTEKKRGRDGLYMQIHTQAFFNDTDHLVSTCKALCMCMWVCMWVCAFKS